MDAQDNNNNKQQLLTLDVGKALRPNHHSLKLTTKKRKQFLQVFAETGNVSRSAATVKVNRASIMQLVGRDEKFKAAFQAVKDFHADQMEEVSINLAQQPTREGLGDRKLQLQRLRPEEYAPKPQVEIKQQITVNNSSREADRILSANNLDPAAIEDIEYSEISNKHENGEIGK